ncbi:hypothetical protein NPX13_g3155 [Xylaria arbuscula]|uniref:Uncharacterized protein n=1 Tax=Xylaria arbuscula TaxID=114810 RepID=A0A9W8NJ03_9PEZI|nr:hypothetical protein NPX13_g3155 [Xylaria arbuscula]
MEMLATVLKIRGTVRGQSRGPNRSQLGLEAWPDTVSNINDTWHGTEEDAADRERTEIASSRYVDVQHSSSSTPLDSPYLNDTFGGLPRLPDIDDT